MEGYNVFKIINMDTINEGNFEASSQVDLNTK